MAGHIWVPETERLSVCQSQFARTMSRRQKLVDKSSVQKAVSTKRESSNTLALIRVLVYGFLLVILRGISKAFSRIEMAAERDRDQLSG